MKVTKEKQRLQLMTDLAAAIWKVARERDGRYRDDLNNLLMVVAMNAALALKETADGKQAAISIADAVTSYVRNPEYVLDFKRRCLATGMSLYENIVPEDDAADQEQLNQFALRALELFGVKQRVLQVICELQQSDPLSRCYSPIAWKKYWPWMAQNFFGQCAS